MCVNDTKKQPAGKDPHTHGEHAHIGHTDDHSQGHTHEHDHDGHARDHAHPHDHNHAHGHEHAHSHDHESRHRHAHSHSSEHERSHEHDHSHDHTHEHSHARSHAAHDHSTHEAHACSGTVLTVRAASGLSGDIMLAGLALMAGATQKDLDSLVQDIGVASLEGGTGAVTLEARSVNGVAGWGCRVTLPHEHAHRTLTDVLTIIDAAKLHPDAAARARAAFTLLAEAEGSVHSTPAAEVTFHEVGALDSILDICLVCALFTRIAPACFVCSPLPLADGGVHCAHGWIPTPAPAVLALLQGVPVCGFAGTGETVTPTAIALLKALGAKFRPWPAMTIAKQALVYGSRVFADAPNGSIWAVGPGCL